MLSLALSIDDYIITSFVAGPVRTFPRQVFDASRVTIPPQAQVLATIDHARGRDHHRRRHGHLQPASRARLTTVWIFSGDHVEQPSK